MRYLQYPYAHAVQTMLDTGQLEYKTNLVSIMWLIGIIVIKICILLYEYRDSLKINTYPTNTEKKTIQANASHTKHRHMPDIYMHVHTLLFSKEKQYGPNAHPGSRPVPLATPPVDR